MDDKHYMPEISSALDIYTDDYKRDPVPDVELLKRVMAHIEARPGEWDQTKWFCGTQACFAGWTCRLSDKVAEIDEYENSVTLKTGEVMFVEDAATKILGLTPYEASTLFSHRCTLHDLQHRVRVIVDPEYRAKFSDGAER